MFVVNRRADISSLANTQEKGINHMTTVRWTLPWNMRLIFHSRWIINLEKGKKIRSFTLKRFISRLQEFFYTPRSYRTRQRADEAARLQLLHRFMHEKITILWSLLRAKNSFESRRIVLALLGLVLPNRPSPLQNMNQSWSLWDENGDAIKDAPLCLWANSRYLSDWKIFSLKLPHLEFKSTSLLIHLNVQISSQCVLKGNFSKMFCTSYEKGKYLTSGEYVRGCSLYL